MRTLLEHDRVPIKMWTDGVEVEAEAMQQVRNVAALPIVSPHVAVMPDVHWGYGATVGSVIPTVGAVIPAAVGVDIGCGMVAARTTLDANLLDRGLASVREAIEDAQPIGGPGVRGSWGEPRFYSSPWERRVRTEAWPALADRWHAIVAKHPKLEGVDVKQLGTLGTGNHFIELCTEVESCPISADGVKVSTDVWIVLHSGSRGPGNRIGTYFINRAKALHLAKNPRPALGDPDLAWLDAGTADFDDYLEAVQWAQDYARVNRELMLQNVVGVLHDWVRARHGDTDAARFSARTVANCHHNYVRAEEHFGQWVWLTRKGAVRAGAGEWGVIPGSMGARTYVVTGLGNPYSFETCSHGAGRRMSRGRAKKEISVEQHAEATAGVECRKDASVLDESPGAYKDIDAVMAAQADLVEVRYVLKQFVCVKG